jgi:lysophospholipase L1-like esterase
MTTHLRIALLALAAFCLASPVSAEEPIRIACVGDSITFGAAIKDRKKNCYPAQLQTTLGDAAIVKNFGNSGSTMLKKGDKPYWRQKEFKAAMEFAPQVVVIKLGTNDTKPQNWKHSAEFDGDYKAMIAEFKALPSKPRIYVCLPVPAFPERWGIKDSVITEEIIPATRKIAEATGASLIDLNKNR